MYTMESQYHLSGREQLVRNRCEPRKISIETKAMQFNHFVAKTLIIYIKQVFCRTQLQLMFQSLVISFNHEL